MVKSFPYAFRAQIACYQLKGDSSPPGKMSELVQDRCGWRKLVVACSAADR